MRVEKGTMDMLGELDRMSTRCKEHNCSKVSFNRMTNLRMAFEGTRGILHI